MAGLDDRPARYSVSKTQQATDSKDAVSLLNALENVRRDGLIPNYVLVGTDVRHRIGKEGTSIEMTVTLSADKDRFTEDGFRAAAERIFTYLFISKMIEKEGDVDPWPETPRRPEHTVY